MTRTDAEIQKDIMDELRWDPSFEDDDIAVSVRNGVVTLAGYTKSYLDKWKAERVASRVKGVRAIANVSSSRSSLDGLTARDSVWPLLGKSPRHMAAGPMWRTPNTARVL